MSSCPCRARRRGAAARGRAGVAADAVGEVVVQALGGGELLDALHVGAHLGLDAGAVLGGQRGERRVRLALGDGRVELEGAPDDLDLVPVRELLEGALQPALADVAPRTHDVGPDLYLHARPTARERPAFLARSAYCSSGRWASARRGRRRSGVEEDVLHALVPLDQPLLGLVGDPLDVGHAWTSSSKSTLAATRIFPGPITEVSSSGTPSTWSRPVDLVAQLAARSAARPTARSAATCSPAPGRRRRRAAAGRSAIAATPSHSGSPVICSSSRPSAASTRPTSAAASSKVTALTVVSVVRPGSARADAPLARRTAHLPDGLEEARSPRARTRRPGRCRRSAAGPRARAR